MEIVRLNVYMQCLSHETRFSVFSVYTAMVHVLLIMLGDSSYYYLHFTSEETEAERNKVS